MFVCVCTIAISDYNSMYLFNKLLQKNWIKAIITKNHDNGTVLQEFKKDVSHRLHCFGLFFSDYQITMIWSFSVCISNISDDLFENKAPIYVTGKYERSTFWLSFWRVYQIFVMICVKIKYIIAHLCWTQDQPPPS